MSEASFTQGVAAEVRFGARRLKLDFARSNRRTELGDLGVLGGEGDLGAVATLQCFRLRVIDLGQLALFAADTVISSGKDLASGALIGLGDGKFLRGELRGIAGGRDIEFIGVHRGLDAEGLLVERRQLVVLRLKAGADGTNFAFAGKDA